jgi:inner membrane protein
MIIILLLVPTFLIEKQVEERENINKIAIEDVSSKWSGSQKISGPFLSIPIIRYEKVTKNSSENLVSEVIDQVQLFPTEYKINGIVSPEIRYRSIYEVVVYNSIINVSGFFNIEDLKSNNFDYKNLQLDNAILNFGITDLRGIENQIQLLWNNDSYIFNPGVTNNYVVSKGISTPVKLSFNFSTYQFSFILNLKGSQNLYFNPVGKVTDITLKSSWINPSFNGAYLPDDRQISKSGFSAHWNILNLNRNFPQVWINDSYNLNDSELGVDLIQPIDIYQKTYRAIKYAFLTLCLTFLAFFFIETLKKKFIHPVQYLLIGISLVLFYSLLLSTSEYINYYISYAISAILTILLISGYVRAILKSNKLTLLMSLMLVILYSFIFIIIQLQDSALLVGSLGIFIILAVVMFLSRKIDWQNLTNSSNNQVH